MKHLYFTPGPSALYFTAEDHVKQALREQVPSISHRGAAFKAIFKEATDNLRALLELPAEWHIVFTASATEVWERIIQNCVAHESYHWTFGSFSERFASISQELGRQVQRLKGAPGTLPALTNMLMPESAELIALTHNETSTGVSMPLDILAQVRKAFPDQLIALDAVSSMPNPIIDWHQLDTAYFSVQKCFGLPAGLGVWLVGPRAVEKAEALLNQGRSIGSYHCLPVLLEKAAKNQTPETPNVLNIYLLAKVAGDMLQKGIEEIRRETAYKSAVIYNAIKEHPRLSCFVEEKAHRSPTVAVAEVEGGSVPLMQHLAAKSLLVGSGYGGFKEAHIRVANFPTHSKEQMEMLADAIMAWS